MDWREFIKQLLEQDLVLSPKEAEALTGIKQPVFDRWKKKPLKRQVHRDTIRKLQAGFSIKIDDSDPENITYIKLPSVVKEASQDYSINETITRADLELLEKLKEMGIDSVEKLNKLCDFEDITEDIKEILKKRMGKK